MTDLPALLSKWLCHDLATPAATVMTASELLGPTGDAEINGLVQDGAKRLVARLRLIRAAFAPGGAAMSGTALERLVRDGIDGTPLTWERPGDASGPEAALVAGAAMLLADLARGSAVTVDASGVRWDAARTLPDSVLAALAGETPTDSRAAVAAMVAAAAVRAGAAVTATADGIRWN
ncbi:hypothetical protein [Polymorphobacter fuscus]|uniref:Histidine phosphotransferase ChpT C-terminal domain-containing protein n=1 Tax=Sandarakinorhabdus fusca TaxID=1439888 RepID=A0A7C9KLR6_9SPHN|nr:hypothetical protein [Polymorphobacter fuscus]KAB7646125.1 hypothetical protein F9290_08615 [Polymorphobacter fuscus]MQT17323.1 hypothetical protein [Polymorphobacter fuscus]NJC10144.1 hypothetical protein [Polymorphobacter fuscus]